MISVGFAGMCGDPLWRCASIGRATGALHRFACQLRVATLRMRDLSLPSAARMGDVIYTAACLERILINLKI